MSFLLSGRSVEKGKLAHLVLLDANPLVNIANTKQSMLLSLEAS